MRYSIKSSLALWTLFHATVLCSAEQQVLTSAAPEPAITADPAVLSHYSSKFFELHGLADNRSGKTKGKAQVTRCTGCNQGPGCCPPGGFARQFTKMPPASSSAHTAVLPSTSAWDSFSLPTTKATESPARTTIFLPATPSATPDAATNPDLAEAKPVAAAAASEAEPKDITSSYYALALTGQHPFELPLILTDGTATPVTVLALVDTTHIPSFISASLVAQLNLTSRVTPHAASSAPLIDLRSLGLGRDATSPGTLSLDVLAGRNDRRIPDARFVVFEPSASAEGPLGWDLSVGMEFLNGAGAVQLTGEFAGVGVKEGLGVVVQRVYSAGANAPRVEHDEL